MSDRNAIERLCELLDERGVEYETDERNAIVEWSTYYGAFVFFARQREGKLLVETTVATKHSVILTPEQAIATTLGSERICKLQAEVDDLEGKIRDLCVAEDEDRAIYEAHIAALEELVRDMWREMLTCPDYATSPCMTNSICERVRNLEIEVS